MDIFVLSQDARENIYINRSSLVYENVTPNEINNYSSPSEILQVEINTNNVINEGAILLYENKYLNQYPELENYQILSDIINVSSSIQLFNSNFYLFNKCQFFKPGNIFIVFYGNESHRWSFINFSAFNSVFLI